MEVVLLIEAHVDKVGVWWCEYHATRLAIGLRLEFALRGWAYCDLRQVVQLAWHTDLLELMLIPIRLLLEL